MFSWYLTSIQLLVIMPAGNKIAYQSNKKKLDFLEKWRTETQLCYFLSKNERDYSLDWMYPALLQKED